MWRWAELFPEKEQADASASFLVALPEFCSFGVVVEVESQGKILTAELTG